MLIRRGQPSRLGRIRRGTQGVRAHMGDGCGLPRRSCGSHRLGSYHLVRSGIADETASDLLCDVKLATGKGAHPGNRSTRAIVAWSVSLEQSKYSLSAVRCP
jgi:hypothetical protein